MNRNPIICADNGTTRCAFERAVRAQGLISADPLTSVRQATGILRPDELREASTTATSRGQHERQNHLTPNRRVARNIVERISV